MKYSGKIKIPSSKVDFLQRAIAKPDGSIPKDCIVWEQTIRLGNKRVVFQVISSLTPSTDPCWTQCSVYDSLNRELACYGVSESLFEKYCFFLGIDEYYIEVAAEK